MTAPFLFAPIFRQFDNAGIPAAGALLFTYSAGSTTPKTTYSDSAGSVPNTNPVVLDSTGSAVVRLGTGAYNFVLKDSSGVTTLWSADQYQASYLAAADIGLLLFPQSTAELAAGVTPSTYVYPWGDVRRYGADPTGSADSTTAINNALLSNGQVYAPKGTYKCLTTLNMKSGQTFYGEGSATVLTANTGSQVQVEMSACIKSTLRDLAITNTAGSGGGHPAAAYLLNCTACTVERVEMSGMWGFGVWIDCSNQCTIFNNYLHDFQGAGNFGDIAIYCLSSTTAGAVGNVIESNRCMGPTNSFGIQLQDPDAATASTGFPRRNLITGNRIGTHIAYGIVHYMSGSSGSPPPPTDCNNQITNNYIENISGTAFSDAGAGIYGVGIGNGGLVITGNTIFNCCTATLTRSLAPAGIGINQVGLGLTPVLIANNNISGMSQGDGILVTTSPGGAEITGNSITMPSTNNGTGVGGATVLGAGIRVAASSNVDIGPNNVKAYGTGAPVFIFTSGFNVSDISLTGGNYSALNSNTANALQVTVDSTFKVTRLTVTGGNYNNVSNVAGTAAVSLNGCTVATLNGVTMNASGTAPGLSVQASTQVRVSGGYINTGGTVAVFTAGTTTNSFLDKSVNWGNTTGATASFMSNSGTGFNVEANFSSVPSAGSWVAGDKAIHLGVTVGTAKGWTRVTTGSGNTLATDWISDGNL
jgi:Pectate lyase superfamily protein/Right handed beta helix region